MKKVLIAVLLTAMIVGNVAAIDVTFDDGGALTDDVKARIIEEIDNKYGKYEDAKDVGRAMSNANAMAATAGYMHSANGYDLFSVAVSGTVAGSVESISEAKDFIDNYKDDLFDFDALLKEGGDKFNQIITDYCNEATGTFKDTTEETTYSDLLV